MHCSAHSAFTTVLVIGAQFSKHHSVCVATERQKSGVLCGHVVALCRRAVLPHTTRPAPGGRCESGCQTSPAAPKSSRPIPPTCGQSEKAKWLELRGGARAHHRASVGQAAVQERARGRRLPQQASGQNNNSLDLILALAAPSPHPHDALNVPTLLLLCSLLLLHGGCLHRVDMDACFEC